MLFSTSPRVSASTIHVFPRTYRDPASPQWWNCNLVSNELRKHDSNRPYALPRFWKSHIDIEIIQSKFVWICYPPIQIREPSKDASKQLEMYFRIFRKSICFRSQLSSLPVSCQDFFTKTRKFTCNSSKRKDSGNVTGQKIRTSGDSEQKKSDQWKNEEPTVLEKVKIVDKQK